MNRKITVWSFVVALFFSLFLEVNIANAASKNLVVHFINIGQGDAIYIKTPGGENILIDAGNKAKGRDVVNYLRKEKVKTIDHIIATHPDADHIGGLDEVIKAFTVKNVYAPKVSHTTQAYKDFLNAVKKKKLKIKTAQANVKLPLRDKSVSAKFVGPVKNYANTDLNNWSAVLHLKYNKNTFLFTGDAETKAEKDMLSKKYISKVDVLKVGHHGAKESSSKEFLNVVKPKYAVISVGKGNRYKHPTTDTLNRLKAVKASIYRTDTQGTIKATSNGNTISFNVKPAIKATSSKKSTSTQKKTNTKKATSTSKTTSYKLTASVDNKTPKQNSTIKLNVKGLPNGTKYKAVFNYKSTKTTYNGKVGTPLSVKIGRAAKGYTVKVNVTSTYKNKPYKAETSFTPK